MLLRAGKRLGLVCHTWRDIVPSPPVQKWVRRILMSGMAGYWLALFVLTHTPAPRVPKVGVDDKLAHFLAYFLLGVLVYATVWATRPHARTAGLWVIAIGMCYGAIDEWTQILVGRDCELMDWAADMGGMISAVLVMTLVRLVVSRLLAGPSQPSASVPA